LLLDRGANSMATDINGLTILLILQRQWTRPYVESGGR
jgi:hypothetical protein